jgi:DNA modification methylase
MSGVELHLGDCLEILPMLEADSVDAAVTDLLWWLLAFGCVRGW